MTRHQATKASRAQLDLHIMRQRNLGEDMIGDHDKPTIWDLLATLAMAVTIYIGHVRGWW